MSKILRGGRLGSKKENVAEFTSSIKDDARLANAVIDINKAHVIMLAEKEIIKLPDASQLLNALMTKLSLRMDASNEDVHMAIEEAVLQKVSSEVSGNLHVGKSRNDQVATAIRMELRHELLNLMLLLVQMQESLANTAEKNVETIILEYTHLQPAQPVTFAHYLLARFDQLNRNLQRTQNAYARVNLCPLGAGALATTSFPIDRERTAQLLGFDSLIENSIDAVGSRDFILEPLAILTLIAIDLSQLAEDLLLWSSLDFAVLELPDEFSSTSSMMPQKKNAEVLEVIRARASHALGDLVAAMTIMKAIPSTYNLDFQEITPKLWDSLKSVSNSLKMFSELIPNLKLHSNVFEKSAESFVAATEVANMLVRKYNVSFRTAHKIVGALVRILVDSKQTFKDATPELLQKVAKETVGSTLTVRIEDIESCIDPRRIVENYMVIGGPAPVTVKKALVVRKKTLTEAKSNINKLNQLLQNAKQNLESTSRNISEGEIAGNARFKNSKGLVE
ncbi:MAG: argininosuccinate lyase [Chloroflexota bacterium]|nr:argininosuccinate lyase [Candidatus Sulfotelmatobacter sp.]